MQKKFDDIKFPVVRIDPSLEKYKGKVLFQEKLDKANAMLTKVGLPKELTKGS